MLVAFAAAIVFSVYILLKKRSDQDYKENVFGLSKGSKVLFVTSHPDDECIFFTPTLLYLINKKLEVSVLCLSTGNFYGQGEKRIVELFKSCENLGIPRERVYCLDKFEDNPKVIWNKEKVSSAVAEYVKKSASCALFTFDENGVSGHRNHIDTLKGVRYLVEENRQHIPLYILETVFVGRKYIQVLDIVWSLLSSWLYPKSKLVVSSMSEYLVGYQSMLYHKSQLLWFRRLYILFSRYMLMNTWKRSDKHDAKTG